MRNFKFMAEIAILEANLAFLTKPEFFSQNILPSKHFESPMVIYIIIVKTSAVTSLGHQVGRRVF